jgi:nitroimidazol reductase NimA-like FMN-containing flavoprotein (pyridoxamine 5'-phosphate oxidase superfamily)
MSEPDARAVLREGEYGVLSTAAADGAPYGVPVNYIWDEARNAIYFHCARAGRKLDNLRANPRVSMIVIGQARVVPERFITHYDSAMVEGAAVIVQDDAERREALLALCQRFSPGVTRRDEVIERYWKAVHLVRIDIQHISGKRNRDD